MFNKTFLLDLADRTISTFVQAFAASLVVTGLDDIKVAVATAAIAGVLAIAKGFAARSVGDSNSAGVVDQFGKQKVS